MIALPIAIRIEKTTAQATSGSNAVVAERAVVFGIPVNLLNWSHTFDEFLLTRYLTKLHCIKSVGECGNGIIPTGATQVGTKSSGADVGWVVRQYGRSTGRRIGNGQVALFVGVVVDKGITGSHFVAQAVDRLVGPVAFLFQFVGEGSGHRGLCVAVLQGGGDAGAAPYP